MPSVPIHTTTEDLPWNTITVEPNIDFDTVTDLTAVVNLAKTYVSKGVDEIRQSLVASTPQTLTLPAGGTVNIHEMIIKSANSAELSARHLLDAIAAALPSLEAKVDVLYLPKDGPPLEGADLIDAPSKAFRPPKLPSFDQEIKIGLSLPVVVELPFKLRFSHAWELVWPPQQVSNAIERKLFDVSGQKPQPWIEGETKGKPRWMERVVTTYLYELKYTADVVMGSLSLPTSSTSFNWFKTHTVASVWS